MSTETKNVYVFGASRTDGDATMKNLLGGKGANLAEMCRLGIVVPPGLTISTAVCTASNGQGRDPVATLVVAEALARGAGPRKALITLGYSGGQAGQLEDEIGRNGWLTVDADPAVIFDTPIEQRYQRALSLLGFDPRMLSQDAGHA